MLKLSRLEPTEQPSLLHGPPETSEPAHGSAPKPAGKTALRLGSTPSGIRVILGGPSSSVEKGWLCCRAMLNSGTQQLTESKLTTALG